MRAELARVAFAMGHHAEVYSGMDELVEHPPQDGIILLREDPHGRGVGKALAELIAAEIWLPIIATDTDPRTGHVVAAIKAGALDYLSLPAEAHDLERVLARIDEEAQANALARRRMVEARSRISRLSRREREVLDWLALGSSNKAIARELDISPRTVEIHRANMMSKLGASHAADAVRLQMEAGLGQGSMKAAEG